MASAGVAHSAEKKSPMMPGAATGNAAALPPEGLYFSNTVTIESGKLQNGSGNPAVVPGTGSNIKSMNVDLAPSLLWVPGWNVLGANYGMAITQPFQWANTDYGGSANGSSTSTKGMFNTIVTPGILSWDLGDGFFASTALSFYLKNGHSAHEYSAAQGRYVLGGSSYANNYWTVEPSFSLSYLADGWNLTLTETLDFNTKNEKTDYYSGTMNYLDVTATKKFGPWELGLIGNYTQQLEDDEVNGQTVAAVDGFNSRGNKAMQLEAGPLIAYDFGKVKLTARYLHGIYAENAGKISFIHLGFSVPIN